MASGHKSDLQEGGDDTGLDDKTPDEELLHSIGLAIRHGADRGKMEIIRMVAKIDSVSKRRVLKLLEAHTGDDPLIHRWRYVVRARGMHAFELHAETAAAVKA